MEKGRLQNIEDRCKWRGIHRGSQHSRKVWRHGTLLPLGKTLCIISKDDFLTRNDGLTYEWLKECCSVSRITLCQYTGRKDKKGVEIYDGDILRYDDGAIVYVCYNYEEHTFALAKNYTEFPFAFPLGRESIMEVIGNLYDNPELIVARTIKRK